MSQIPPVIPYQAALEPAAAAPNLPPQQVQEQLAAARLGAKKLRRAASYATFDAWTIALFAAASLSSVFFGSFSGLAIGAVMGILAFIEFKGAARIRRLDPSAIKMLGYNQLAFAGLLILYSLWSIHNVSTGTGGVLPEETKQQLSQVVDLTQIEGWIKTGFYAVYVLLIAIAIFAQGGTAMYYFTREKHLRRYLQTTPAWVVQMQRAGAPL